MAPAAAGMPTPVSRAKLAPELATVCPQEGADGCASAGALLLLLQLLGVLLLMLGAAQESRCCRRCCWCCCRRCGCCWSCPCCYCCCWRCYHAFKCTCHGSPRCCCCCCCCWHLFGGMQPRKCTMLPRTMHMEVTAWRPWPAHCLSKAPCSVWPWQKIWQRPVLRAQGSVCDDFLTILRHFSRRIRICYRADIAAKFRESKNFAKSRYRGTVDFRKGKGESRESLLYTAVHYTPTPTP